LFVAGWHGAVTDGATIRKPAPPNVAVYLPFVVASVNWIVNFFAVSETAGDA
jgi:hypothetical protein